MRFSLLSIRRIVSRCGTLRIVAGRAGTGPATGEETANATPDPPPATHRPPWRGPADRRGPCRACRRARRSAARHLAHRWRQEPRAHQCLRSGPVRQHHLAARADRRGRQAQDGQEQSRYRQARPRAHRHADPAGHGAGRRSAGRGRSTIPRTARPIRPISRPRAPRSSRWKAACSAASSAVRRPGRPLADIPYTAMGREPHGRHCPRSCGLPLTRPCSPVWRGFASRWNSSGSASARLLSEEDGLHLRIRQVGGVARLGRHGQTTLHGRAGQNAIEPCLHVRELGDVLPLPLP